MKSHKIKNIFGLILLVVVVGLVGCGNFSSTVNETSGEENVKEVEENEIDVVDFKIDEVVNGLYVPWSIVFTSEARILVAERNGNIRVIENGYLLEKPLLKIEDVVERDESGLMGMAADPDYKNNRYLYACYSYSKNGNLTDKVVRIVDDEKSAKIETTILDDIPAARYHAGCRVEFGPDGKLYITSGDATEGKLAQDMNSLAGKILRINKDGSIPTDNPFENSPIYSAGHRNPQGLAWDKEGTMYETEHGPSIFDGPPGGDEVNIIVAGENYGWPIVSHEESKEGLVDPKMLFTPAAAPASAMLYSGKMFPQFAGNLFFGGLRGEGLFRVVFENGEAVSYQKMDWDLGRIRDVVEAPDGSIYFSSSNRDGRGDPRDGDDKIFKLVEK